MERQWCADRRREGWVAGRIAGSKGPFDAFAVREMRSPDAVWPESGAELILAQMKSGGIHTFDGFSPSSRLALSTLAAQAGGRAVLVRKRTRQVGYTEHFEDEWPP